MAPSIPVEVGTAQALLSLGTGRPGWGPRHHQWITLESRVRSDLTGTLDRLTRTFAERAQQAMRCDFGKQLDPVSATELAAYLGTPTGIRHYTMTRVLGQTMDQRGAKVLLGLSAPATDSARQTLRSAMEFQPNLVFWHVLMEAPNTPERIKAGGMVVRMGMDMALESGLDVGDLLEEYTQDLPAFRAHLQSAAFRAYAMALARSMDRPQLWELGKKWMQDMATETTALEGQWRAALDALPPLTP